MARQPRSDDWGRDSKNAPGDYYLNEDAIGILPLRVIVPLMDWKERYQIAPWMVRIDPEPANNLSKTSAADAFQIRSVSQARFVNRLGRISSDQLREILEAVQTVIGA